jgi:hypothetical protein
MHGRLVPLPTEHLSGIALGSCRDSSFARMTALVSLTLRSFMSMACRVQGAAFRVTHRRERRAGSVPDVGLGPVTVKTSGQMHVFVRFVFLEHIHF